MIISDCHQYFTIECSDVFKVWWKYEFVANLASLLKNFVNDNEREFIQRVVKQISHALITMVPMLLCEQNCL